MRKMILRKVTTVLLLLSMLMALVPTFAESAQALEEKVLVTTVADTEPDLLKFGNIILAVQASEFLKTFEIGDIVTVQLGGLGSYEAPVCGAYGDVLPNEKVLRIHEKKDAVILAINSGNMAMEAGIVQIAPEGSETAYILKPDLVLPISATVTLTGKGYQKKLIGNLVRTDVREDYPNLTDAQFANMRAVKTTGIGEGRLYRSSSPICPEIGRNLYADAAAKEAGVKTFINLADTEAEAAAYPDYAQSYYRAQNHIFLGLPVAVTSDVFRNGLAEGFRFMIAHEPPYLVHCKEGKDRAGLCSALLSCLMGASYDEIIEDYALTYHHFYSVEKGTQRSLTEEELKEIGDLLINNLKLVFETEITPETDLSSVAGQYMLSIGLTEEEVTALKACLK